MKKLVILFIILFIAFSQSTSFSQDTTVAEALAFIKTNLNYGGKSVNKTTSNSFDEIFSTDDSRGMNYDFTGEYSYLVISTSHCKVTLVETVKAKTRISLSEDDERPDDARIYSNFGYLKEDTITIDFSKISRIESDKATITLIAYNNENTIQHNGRTTWTPPKKRNDDLVRHFKEDEEDLYRKLKKFMIDNKLNYDTYPNKIEKFSEPTGRYTINIADKERNQRLVRAFNFLHKHCGVPKEKF